MDLRQLTALVTVAETGSVTRAAAVLHLVQPAVSRQIRSLEEEFGVSLFERTRNGMVPTEAGVVLVARARRALAELERARAEIRPDPGVVTGIVGVGLLESVIELVAEPLVAAVRSRHPGIELRLLTAYSGHLQHWLDNGDVDLSLLYNLADTQAVAVLPLLVERLWVAAPSTAELRPDRPIDWKSALQHPMVFPSVGHGLRALVDQGCSGSATPATISVETNSMYLQKKLVRAGHGWTVLPAVGVAADVAAGRLTGAPLTAPETSRSVVLGLQRGTRTPPAVDAVADELIRLIRSAVISGEWPSARWIGPR